MEPHNGRYRGRFAPSPSGQLHFGSLAAALASYLDARHQQGEWLLRIEDLDPPRTVPGAANEIMATLERFGFQWDGPVLYQSQRSQRYQAVIEQLQRQRLLYPCGCSRSEIAAMARPGVEGPIYPGRCRNGPPAERQPLALRLRCHDQPITFVDRIQGPQRQCIESEVGDFVLRRADGLFAYQLAVVVDDQEQGINQIVRGSDLLFSTPRQIHLQQLLGYRTPSYAHIPLALDAQGRKLSKSDQAPALDLSNPQQTLNQVLRFLHQVEPDPGLPLDQWWQQAISGWQLQRISSAPAGPAGPPPA